MFQNKTNIKIIGFALGFWICLSFLTYSLWNKDLLDTHLDLLDTDITSKNFVCLREVLKTSSRYVLKTSSRHVLKTFSRHVFKASSRHVFQTSSRRLQDVLEDAKLLRWRRVEDVFKTCLEDVFKMSWRPANVCWVASLIVSLRWFNAF